jgi:hypothetical protein
VSKHTVRSTQLLVPLLAVLQLASCGRSAADGRPLLRKVQNALGGADRIAAIRDYEQVVRAGSWNGNTGESIGTVVKRTRWIRPNYLRIDQVGPGSTYVLYCDGVTGWEILPGTTQAVELQGGELEFARDMAMGLQLNIWIADRAPRYRIITPSPDVVRISNTETNHRVDIAVDPKSGLPTTLSFTTLSDPAHPVPGEDVIAAWEIVQGVRFPSRWTVIRDGRRVAEANEVTNVVNGGLELATLSARPLDGRPAVASR